MLGHEMIEDEATAGALDRAFERMQRAGWINALVRSRGESSPALTVLGRQRLEELERAFVELDEVLADEGKPSDVILKMSPQEFIAIYAVGRALAPQL